MNEEMRVVIEVEIEEQKLLCRKYAKQMGYIEYRQFEALIDGDGRGVYRISEMLWDVEEKLIEAQERLEELENELKARGGK